MTQGNKASRITGCAVGFIVVTDLLCSGVLSVQNYETLPVYPTNGLAQLWSNMLLSVPLVNFIF